MNKIKLIFNNSRKYRVPQYSMSNGDFIIPHEKEREIWLRIPVKISEDNYSIEFFIQSKVYIQKIEDFGCIEDLTYFLTTQSFPDRFSRLPLWNVLTMQDYYPLNDYPLSKLLKEEISGNNNLPFECHVGITDEFHNYLLDTSIKISEANAALDKCKQNLEKLVSSSVASGFCYMQGEIQQYLDFIRNCSHNLSDQSSKTHYFRKNLKKIEIGFEELIKRKQVNNFKYQYHLNEIRTALYHLSKPDVWEGRIPIAPDLSK
jgi:hypothetical protein